MLYHFGAFMRRLNLYHLAVLFILVVFSSCSSNGEEETQNTSAERYNILWLVAEDLGPYIPPFGDSTVATPNLSRLAAEGVRFTNFYSPSGVCAPSRAAIATGLYPSSFGANHMRTGSHTEVTGLPAYQAVPPTEAKMLSEMMRLSGYYCTNNVKGDYQFQAPPTAWDEYSYYGHWRNRGEGQPFYSIFNFTITHESGLFEPYGIRQPELRHYNAGDTSFQVTWGVKTPEAESPVYLPKNTDFSIPPYLPDNEIVKRDMWKMYNNIAEMDAQLGAVLDQLEENGLLENTIIFFYGDHGGPLPRQKRLIYDAGLKVPLIVRFPDKKGAGTINDELLSFIDLAPTLLTIAGETPPAYLHGRNFIDASKPERKYIHAAADRFDEYTDAIRAVRDKQFKYIRNYRPDQGYYLPVGYREQIPTMRELLKLRDAGQLTEAQAQWFRKSKPKEELFDCMSDPHELNNLAELPEYAEKLKELSDEMDRWIDEIGDQPNLPERDLISQLWNGEEAMPRTENPMIVAEDMVSISCATKGASIGYRISENNGLLPEKWNIYTEPFTLEEGLKLEVLAHRIGYTRSDTVTLEM